MSSLLAPLSNPVGIMQGRLLPIHNGHYQAHPTDNWWHEFTLARQLSLECIEFIIDEQSYQHNPLLSHQGVSSIISYINSSQVNVYTICADIFMKRHLFTSDTNLIQSYISLLKTIIESATSIKCKVIVLPCVDASSLSFDKNNLFINNMRPVAEFAAERGVKLALETDLPPMRFLDLLNSFTHGTIFVNYDSGNSASLGYNIIDEFNAYGSYICDIHIKDRLFAGPSVPLGKGSANLLRLIKLIEHYKLYCPLIFQTYRDHNPLETFLYQLDYFQHIVKTQHHS